MPVDPQVAELMAERAFNETEAQKGNPHFQGCLGCEFHRVTSTNYIQGEGADEPPVCTAPPGVCEYRLAYQ